MRYVRKKADGSWEYSDEPPTDPNEPIITEDDVKARAGQAGYPYGESYAMKALGRESERATAPGPEERLGAGRALPGGLTEYVGPGGISETHTAEGRLLSEGMPQHYTNKYSPRDQRKVEKLYQDRSHAATDPEIDEDARQSALEQIDMQLSQIPVLSPQMREPSAQERFDQSLVKAPDGRMGTINPRTGGFTPIETDKAEADRQKDYRETYGKVLQEGMSFNDKLKDTDPLKMSFSEVRERAKVMTDDIFGRLGQSDEPGYAQDTDQDIVPELKTDWESTIVKLAGDRPWFRTVTEAQMQKGLDAYVGAAYSKGIPGNMAVFDFLNRWFKRQGYSSIPKMSKKWEDKLELARLAAKHSDRPTGTLPTEQSFAAVGGVEQEIPTGPVAKMGVGKGAGLQDMSHLLTQQWVTVKDKQGKLYKLPASQLKDALAENYTQVK